MLPNDPGDPTVEVDEVAPVDLEEPLAVRPASTATGRAGVSVRCGSGCLSRSAWERVSSSGCNSRRTRPPRRCRLLRAAPGSPAAPVSAAAPGSAAPPALPAPGPRAGGAGGGATVGQVKLIDGTNVYVTDTTGNTVKVATTGSTISKSAPATVTDLAIGDTIIVRGATGSDGTVAATAITDSGAGGAAGFGRGGGAGGAGGAGGG